MMYWSEDLKEAKYWMRSHLDTDAALLQGEGDEGIMVRARTLYFVSLLSLVCKSAGFIKSQSLFFITGIIIAIIMSN